MQKVGAPAVAAANLERGKRTFARLVESLSDDWMSVADLMSATDINETSVKRLMQKAEDDGVAVREKRLITGRIQYAFRRVGK